MKTYTGIFLVLLLLLLSACGQSIEAVTAPETAPPPEITIAEATQLPTEPVHSLFYLPGVPVEDVIANFAEVCLDAEFINSGDPCLLQKWQTSICYTLNGSYTETDLAVLAEFTAWLNTIQGFPGIREAREGDAANLRLHFCSQPEMISLMGESFYGLDGAVTFWYDDDAIYDAIICCRSDIDQHTRNSVILEELYNGLGPIQDTDLRTDSIIYGGFSEPQTLTEMDELILKLLYHPDMRCGMDATQCAEVIRTLYY